MYFTMVKNFLVCSVMCHVTNVKLAIHLSFLTFRHVRALFCELFRKIANQSLYTSHNITDFVHLWFFEKFDEKLSLSPLWHFVKILTVWRKWRNERWEKWLARWFMKCHLYTYRFSHFANIFSRSHQFDDKCIASLRLVTDLRKGNMCTMLSRGERVPTWPLGSSIFFKKSMIGQTEVASLLMFHSIYHQDTHCYTYSCK